MLLLPTYKTMYQGGGGLLEEGGRDLIFQYIPQRGGGAYWRFYGIIKFG
ncbi:MAG: hypothetical protein GY820_36460 [Gammaproteobacteria bacterium]|nr:hypothetical protein [Gammaproteobacteria bacterium]